MDIRNHMYFIVLVLVKLSLQSPLCESKVGIHHDTIEYVAKICKQQSVLDVELKRGMTKHTTGKPVITKDYTLNGVSRSFGRKAFPVNRSLTFTKNEVLKMQDALSRYLRCIRKINVGDCTLPTGINLDNDEHKRIDILMEKNVDHLRYNVKQFKITVDDEAKVKSRFRRNVNSTITPQTNVNIVLTCPGNNTKCHGWVVVTARPNMLNSFNKIQFHYQSYKSTTRTRRDLLWMDSKVYSDKFRIPESLKIITKGLSALSQSRLF